MGGFAFRLDGPTANQRDLLFNTDHRRLTLTARGVTLLADCGLLPKIKKEDICDKSKSDGLSKFIACVQAAWMFVQITGRLAAGLQITLLEVNTLGHVFCALVMYVLWWHKPRMVREPIIIEGDWADSLCAYMYMSSRVSGRSSSGLDDSKIKPEISSVAFVSEKSPLDVRTSVKQGSTMTSRHLSNDRIAREGAATFSSPHLLLETSLTPGSSTGGSFRPRPRPADYLRGALDLTARSNEIDISGDEQHRYWDLAAQAVHTYPAIKRRFREMNYKGSEGEASVCLQEDEPEELLVVYPSNWSTRGLLHGEHGLKMGIILWFASMAFGGIHAAAWHNYFPSKGEAWLWRCSAIYIAWSGLVWLTINLSAKLFKPIDDLWNGQRLSRAPWVKSWLLALLFAVCGSLYLFARLYLVVEAFISIRQLQVDAYQTPNWTGILPHL